LLSSEMGTSKETELSTFCPSSSLPTTCKRQEKSVWSKFGPAKIQPTYSPSHCPHRPSGSSRIKLVCGGFKTSSKVHNRGSDVCCTLFPSPWFCPTGFSW